MIFIKVDESSKNVTFIHYQPFDSVHGLGKTQEHLEQEGYLVDSIPEPQEVEGKIPVLKFDGTNLYYEYVDRPLTPEEKLQLLEQENQDLKNRVELMQQAMDELLLGGM
jgi:hypothetical protein